MARNIVLLASTLGILGVIFVAYVLLLDDPAVDERDHQMAIEALPTDTGLPSDTLKIAGAIEVPPGEAIELKVYDEHTGQIKQLFQCDEWTPISGNTNDIFVANPRFKIWLPRGMIATISAVEGQITVDSLKKVQGRPQSGWLNDDVRILIDRETSRERTPIDTRPEDLITIALDHLDFDLELGTLKTEGPIQITSTDFEIAGSGLDLLWNEAENMVESLWLHQGQRMVLYGGGGQLFSAAAKKSPETAAAPTPERKPPSKRGGVAYNCVLSGGIIAEQFASEECVGGFSADEVRLLFDLGRSTNRLTDGTPTSRPSSQPTTQPTQRLVVHWSGPLRLDPGPAVDGDQTRRRFEAYGTPVKLRKGGRTVECGRLEYYQETEQIWLHPSADGQVHFGLGTGRYATAGSVYIDSAANLIKLVGDVRVVTQGGDGPVEQQRSINCSLWAELHLAQAPASEPNSVTAEAAGDDLISYGRLDSAAFVGEAEVELGDRTLTADQIDVTFHSADADQPLDTALDTAIAAGHVRLVRKDEVLESEQLTLAFAVTEDGKLYPQRIDATGSVVIARDRSWLRGRRVQAELQPVPPSSPADGPEFVIRSLDITGDAELRDPKNKVAARGQHISARFTGLNRLREATIRGTADRHGLVHASPYTVGGEQVDLDWDAKTLHVDGPARLKFKTVRSLQGQQRRRPTPVTVRCAGSLHIDGIRNTIRFAENVVAESGEEQLYSDTLTLLLEDVEKPTVTDSKPPGITKLVQQARQALAEQFGTDRQHDWLELSDDQDPDLRKEPVRLIAEHALFQSETYQPGDVQPLIHTSIAAPLLEVDIVGREIITSGQTTLLLTNRRLDGDDRLTDETLGVPSALITRGPSQTAMQCDGSMTYALGTEGPTRRDSVLFEDGVRFAHRTGSEMINAEQMLPELQVHPELITDFESRNTMLTCDRLECGFQVGGSADAGEPAPMAGRESMRLTWLLASGNAYLRDKQGLVIREVYTQQIDFDRQASLIRILGTPLANARIYEEHLKTGGSRVLLGEEFIIDLESNAISTKTTSGEFRMQN